MNKIRMEQTWLLYLVIFIIIVVILSIIIGLVVYFSKKAEKKNKTEEEDMNMQPDNNNTVVLVDGEFITRDINDKYVQLFCLFDIYTAPDEKDVSQMPFITPDTTDGRYIQLQNWIQKWNDGSGPQIVPGCGVTKKNMIQVSMKEFLKEILMVAVQ